MSKMLKKFAVWFICFGLSFLAQELGWAEQGKAFLWIIIGADVLIILGIIAIVMIAGLVHKSATIAATGFSVVLALITAGMLVIVLFATWGATKLFDVDFYVAFQIMSFGECLCIDDKKEN